MIAMYAALGGGGGAMASSSSRSLPAASSSALLSASFPGPGLWRRRRMLVGCVVVSLSLRVKLSSSASLRVACVVSLACQAVGARRKLLLQGYRLQIVFSSELGSVDAQIYLLLRCFFAKHELFSRC